MSLQRHFRTPLFLVLLVIGAIITWGSVVMMTPKSETNVTSPYPKMKAKAPLADEKIVAQVDGVNVSEDEMIGPDLMVYYNIKQREFEFKQARLRSYITQYFLNQKTKELGISIDDYIRNHVVKDKNIMPSDEEIKAFAQDQKLPPLDQIKQNEQALAQITQFLRKKKEFDLLQIEVNKWTLNHKIEYYFSRPSLPVNIPLLGSPSLGHDKAKVVIIQFGDLEDSFTAKAVETLDQIKKIYGNKVNIVFKNMPLPQHTNSLSAALIGICLSQQSDKKFWDYYALTLKNHLKLSEGTLKKYALQVKADQSQLETCLSGPTAKAQVQQDMELASRLGLESTPIFFINGEVITGSAPLGAFQEIIEYYLE